MAHYSASAQTWEVGAFGGSSAYMGDLNPVNPFKVRNIAGGILVKRNFDPRWSLKLGYMHGKLQANDRESGNPDQEQRKLDFFSPLNELSVQGEFNFFDFLADRSKKRYSPFLFAGVAGISFNPRTKFEGKVYELPQYRTEDQAEVYKTYALSVPYGAGFKYNLKGAWNLVGEIGYRTALTDYLDDVSKYYLLTPSVRGKDPAFDLRSDLSNRSGVPVVHPETQRGDLRPRDTYMFVGVSITYTFFSRKCPPVF